MKGQKPDSSIREPLVWSSTGLKARSNPFQTHWESIVFNDQTAGVEEQTGDPASLLSHYRSLIQLRNQSDALLRGDFQVLHSSNVHVIAFQRTAGKETVTVLCNLSQEPQPFDLGGLEKKAGKLLFCSPAWDDGIQILRKGGTVQLPAQSTVIFTS